MNFYFFICRLSMLRLRFMLVLTAMSFSLPADALDFPTVVEDGKPGEDAELHLPVYSPITEWKQKEKEEQTEEQKTELKKVLQQNVRTLKLDNVVPPIQFKSGQADIPESYVQLLRDILDKMKHRLNVRLHFIGHTDDVKLSGSLKEKYGDNEGLSRERAGTTAEYFQRALHLPPEAISFDGMGERKPVASNATEAGRAKNRRVEVQVWYDEVDEKLVEKKVKIQQDIKRVNMCRVETLCKISYKEGHSHRARLRNLVQPLRYEDGMSEIPASFINQLKQALNNLKNKKNVTIKFIGHTDNLPLTGRLGRIYGEHVALSKANARRIALAVQEKLKLPNKAIAIDGKGAAWPVASNDVETGRAANRRIEVEFWHDDPLQTFSPEPQLCPETAGAETVERIYEPPAGNVKPIYFEHGKPVIPPGYIGRLKRIMAEVADKGNVRVRFIGYTNNARLDRRTAMVYGDDIGLSTSRARRAMESVKELGGFTDKQLEYEGHGFVHSDDVVNTGFLEVDESRVEARVIYDDLAELDDLEGLQIERITRDVSIRNPMSLNLMRISIDGVPVDDMGKSSADVQRCTDVALEKADVQFKFDNLEVKPRLNITAWPTTIRYRDDLNTGFPENLVTFKAYTNYSSFIDKYEVRVFRKEQSTRDVPFQVLPITAGNEVEWFIKLDEATANVKQLKYVLRVYDKQGHFDETQPKPLWVVSELKELELTNPEEEKVTKNIIGDDPLLEGYGEARLALQTIPINGGTVKVTGSKIPENHSVWFAGREVPQIKDGRFTSEEILPQGVHSVEVAMLDESGNGELFLRDLELKKNDWFFVGIADFTLSQDSTNGPADLVTGDKIHYDNDTVADGRIAFYTHGKFGDEWELIASADTLEGPIDDLFSNFMDKSPEALFRRLDPDYYYPTFGDDSMAEEMAPTLGKFFIKLKKDKNYGMWGNFKIAYTENSIAHVDRTLYGANVHYENDKVTSFGEKTFTADIFAAEPGTINGRDEFLGTGGSLYFLRHQDILVGSDRLRIEIRDKLSGQVLAVKNLVPAIDYDLDTIQGRILLAAPLSATSSDGSIVSGSGQNEQYLVARYEYSPGFDDSNQLSTGGRVQGWLTDQVKLGATFSSFGEGDEEDSLSAVDATFRKTAGTWIKLEHATHSGLGDAASLSADGGYNFNQLDTSLLTSDETSASKVDASVQFDDLFDGVKGKATFYRQDVEAGYSSPGITALNDTTVTGGTVEYPVIDDLNLKLKSDKKTIDNGLETSAVELDADYKLTDQWTLSSGVKRDERTDRSPVIVATQQQGERTDLAVKASYDSKDDWTAYGFVQDTVTSTGNRDSNDRVGLGGEYRATDKLKLNGELSGGELGTGARIGTDYQVSDKTNMYLNYTLDNERTDNGVLSREGNLTSGFKSKYSDSASVYVEEKYSHGDIPTGLTHSMGTDITPNDRFTFGASLDIGTLEDQQTSAVTDRQAIGFRFGYSHEKTKYAGAIEYREDNIENPDATTSDRVTILYKNSLKYQVNENWRLIARLNHSTSESSLGEFYNGDFTEAVLGYAYRPVKHDNINALIKYTYFYNLPATDQQTLTNTAAEYIQRSKIISLDIMYDLTSRWSLGGKYAHRFGEISTDRVNPEFFDSNADLVVLRADWHFTHRWDALIEARQLEVPEAGDKKSGALLAFYRHFKKHAKVGLGYNFTDFSDDLTDLDYDSEGFFINVVAKF